MAGDEHGRLEVESRVGGDRLRRDDAIRERERVGGE